MRLIINTHSPKQKHILYIHFSWMRNHMRSSVHSSVTLDDFANKYLSVFQMVSGAVESVFLIQYVYVLFTPFTLSFFSRHIRTCDESHVSVRLAGLNCHFRQTGTNTLQHQIVWRNQLIHLTYWIRIIHWPNIHAIASRFKNYLKEGKITFGWQLE